MPRTVSETGLDIAGGGTAADGQVTVGAEQRRRGHLTVP